MSDPSFRRYFLVQLLVILQYLTLPVKFKTDSQVLSEDQADFSKKTSEKIDELLSESPPQGCEFVKCVKHILRYKKKKKPWRQIGDSIKDASEKNKILLCHTELTRLRNICPDNIEACRMKSRNFMPQLDAFFREAFKEMEVGPTSLSVLMDSSKKDFKSKKY
ncbi:unnamed protein product [Orchesella dallaii]|uniref:Uncharacterized protein n=1 Tax=Orchesella dallaii TaxID=48710 RepID=A0ABP1PWD6_9HEXA